MAGGSPAAVHQQQASARVVWDSNAEALRVLLAVDLLTAEFQTEEADQSNISPSSCCWQSSSTTTTSSSSTCTVLLEMSQTCQHLQKQRQLLLLSHLGHGQELPSGNHQQHHQQQQQHHHHQQQQQHQQHQQQHQQQLEPKSKAQQGRCPLSITTAARAAETGLAQMLLLLLLLHLLPLLLFLMMCSMAAAEAAGDASRQMSRMVPFPSGGLRTAC